VEFTGGIDQAWSRRYWTRKLAGAALPPEHPRPSSGSDGRNDGEYAEIALHLDRASTTRLREFCRRSHLTMNTVAQTAWAIALHRRTGRQDVTFGVVVAGRSFPFERIDRVVGMLANALPLRIHVDPDAEAMRCFDEVQRQIGELQRAEATSLGDLRRWLDLPAGQPLFDSVVRFQNYPRRVDGERGGIFDQTPVMEFDRWHYPMTLGIVPGEELLLQLSSDTSRVDANTACQVLAAMQNVLERIAHRPPSKVRDLLE
jgi:non-ribosomal peptide synthetase component F